MNQIVFPVRAIASEGIDTSKLLKKQPLQIGLSEKKTPVFNENDFLILDFGAEMCGGIRILTFIADKVPVRIRFGESITECCAELGEKNATNDHAFRDFTTTLTHYSDSVHGSTGFRFVRLDFGGKVRIKSIVALNQILKKPAIYRYEGKDEEIREIYNVAKRTVDLCASSGFIRDGIKRDRLVWVGDMSPEVIALTTLYGALPCTEKSLDFIREQTPLPGWMNDFPMYSMWWIIVLADYYEKTKRKAFLKRQIPYLAELVMQMDGCVKEDGQLDYPSYFVDWPTHGKPDELAGVRAINMMAMKAAIALLREFGKDPAPAEAILARLLKIEIHAETSKQVLGLKHFATELTEEDKKNLVAGGAKGMSTFMSYYILKAVASFDREKAIEMMKEYFGAMLDKGATTFWEDFDIQWAENSSRIDEFPKEGEKDIHGDFGAFCYQGFRHSLCHGWSAGVIGFLKEENV